MQLPVTNNLRNPDISDQESINQLHLNYSHLEDLNFLVNLITN